MVVPATRVGEPGAGGIVDSIVSVVAATPEPLRNREKGWRAPGSRARAPATAAPDGPSAASNGRAELAPRQRPKVNRRRFC
jgi:hypothetical protein